MPIYTRSRITERKTDDIGPIAVTSPENHPYDRVSHGEGIRSGERGQHVAASNDRGRIYREHPRRTRGLPLRISLRELEQLRVSGFRTFVPTVQNIYRVSPLYTDFLLWLF